MKKSKRQSNSDVKVKNSGTESKSFCNSGGQTGVEEQSPLATVAFKSNRAVATNLDQRKISSPTLMIGRERSDIHGTSGIDRKVKYRLHEVIAKKCLHHRKSDKGQ